MKRVPLNHLCPALSLHVRDTMLRWATPNCCIATVAVLRRAMKHFHYDSSPLAVYLTVENARMVELMEAGERVPDTEPERTEWFERTRAYGIGITADSPGEFSGHLVLYVPIDIAGGIILDASLDQCNRPMWGIRLPKMASIRFRPQTLEQCALACMINGCRVTYQKCPERSWRTAPDWVNAGVAYRDALNEILRKTKASIAAHSSSGVYPVEP